jgi:hypothetical protein
MRYRGSPMTNDWCSIRLQGHSPPGAKIMAFLFGILPPGAMAGPLSKGDRKPRLYGRLASL